MTGRARPPFTSSPTRRSALGTALALGVTGLASSACGGGAGPTDGAAQPAPSGTTGPTSGLVRPPTPNGRSHSIAAGNHTVGLASVGATFLSWKIRGEEILFTHPVTELEEKGDYQGRTLVPWCNRIPHGEFSFQGQRYAVPINDQSTDTALHGLLAYTDWQTTEAKPDRATFETWLPPSTGYPWSLTARMTYLVAPDGLTCTLTVKNIGNTVAPFSCGHHPWIAAPTGKRVDDLVLRLPANTYYQADANHVVTTKGSVADTPWDFRAGKPVGSTVFNQITVCDFVHQDGKAVCEIRRPGGASIQVWLGERLNYCLLYSDDSPATASRAKRVALAFEPYSSAPNCFNNGDGLITLAPDEQWEGSWGYSELI